MVFLDASAISYLQEGDATIRRNVVDVLAALRTGGDPPPLAVSALSRLECRVRPLRDADTALLARYDEFFSEPGLIVMPLDRLVIDLATELRARVGLRTPDALQAASALALDKDAAFVTGDGDFSAVPGLRLVRVGAD